MKESFYCLRFHILYQVHNSPHKWHCSPALMHSQNLETFTCISFMYIYAPLVHWICCLDLNMYIDSCSTIRIAMTMNTIIQGRSNTGRALMEFCTRTALHEISLFHLQYLFVTITKVSAQSFHLQQ